MEAIHDEQWIKEKYEEICRQNPATFCEMTLEKAFFTRGVNGCISGVVWTGGRGSAA